MTRRRPPRRRCRKGAQVSGDEVERPARAPREGIERTASDGIELTPSDGIERFALAELIWQQTSRLRRSAHRAAGQARCWSRYAPYGPADPDGTRVRGDCLLAGCLDIVHDIYSAVEPRLAPAALRRKRNAYGIRNHLRYANTVIGREVSDYERRRRVAIGLPAKPTRTDGAAAALLAALAEAAADEVATRWLHALFRMMRSYVCLPHRPYGWPLERWSLEKTVVDGIERVAGSDAARREISADMALVLRLAGEVAGARWLHENILDPLLAGGYVGQVDDHRLTAVTPAGLDEELIWRLFRDCYVDALSRGATRRQALTRSCRRVLGENTPKLTPRLRELLDDIEHEHASTPLRRTA
jgi:hypothetical protein